MANLTPPPDDTAFAEAGQTPDVHPDLKERLFRGLLSTHPGGSIDQAMDKHHQARLNEAQMHRKSAATAAGALHSIDTLGKHPETGEDLSSPDWKDAKGRNREQLRQYYQDNFDSSMASYEKVAGVNKETKGAIGK